MSPKKYINVYAHKMFVIMLVNEKFYHVCKCAYECNVDMDIMHKMPMIIVHVKRNKIIYL